MYYYFILFNICPQDVLFVLSLRVSTLISTCKTAQLCIT